MEPLEDSVEPALLGVVELIEPEPLAEPLAVAEGEVDAVPLCEDIEPEELGAVLADWFQLPEVLSVLAADELLALLLMLVDEVWSVVAAVLPVALTSVVVPAAVVPVLVVVVP